MSIAGCCEPSVLRLRIVQPYVPLRWNIKRERVCNRHIGLRRWSRISAGVQINEMRGIADENMEINGNSGTEDSWKK